MRKGIAVLLSLVMLTSSCLMVSAESESDNKEKIEAYTYEYIGDNQHIKRNMITGEEVVEDCDYADFLNVDDSNSEIEQQICRGCLHGATDRVKHDYEYISLGKGIHEAKCKDCGLSMLEFCELYLVDEKDPNTYMCPDCKFIYRGTNYKEGIWYPCGAIRPEDVYFKVEKGLLDFRGSGYVKDYEWWDLVPWANMNYSSINLVSDIVIPAHCISKSEAKFLDCYRKDVEIEGQVDYHLHDEVYKGN